MIPFFEWVSTLMILNYFVLISDFDDYYDAVANIQSNVMQRAFAVKV